MKRVCYLELMWCLKLHYYYCHCCLIYLLKIKKYYLNILASAVNPEMDIPICSSIGIIFFWYADSSLTALFNAIRTAYCLFFNPTVAEPSLTASMAYSTWWRRPWGLHTVTSLSYWFLNCKSISYSVNKDYK